MIERIRILNFQKHQRLEVLFEGITTFVGQSDAGKSAIIRALRWCLSNKPRGTAHITHGEPGCTVAVKIDGTEIVRRQGKGTNEYKMGEAEYVSFGANVPDAITEFLGMREDVNFQMQMDPVFWLQLSDSEASAELNRMADMDEIDSVFKYLTGEKRQVSSTLKIRESDLVETSKKVKELEWAERAATEFEGIVLAENRVTSADKFIANLEGLCNAIAYHSQLAAHQKNRLGVCQQAGLALRDVLDAQDSEEDLSQLIRECAVPETLPEFEVGYDAWASAKTEETQLLAMVDSVQRAVTSVDASRERLKGLEDALETFKTCPTCNSLMKT